VCRRIGRERGEGGSPTTVWRATFAPRGRKRSGKSIFFWGKRKASHLRRKGEKRKKKIFFLWVEGGGDEQTLYSGPGEKGEKRGGGKGENKWPTLVIPTYSGKVELHRSYVDYYYMKKKKKGQKKKCGGGITNYVHGEKKGERILFFLSTSWEGKKETKHRGNGPR